MSEEDKPKQLLDDASLNFAERHGYVPMPDTTNYKLCHEFRDAIGNYVNKNFPPLKESSFQPEADKKAHKSWLGASIAFQKDVRKLSYRDVATEYPKCKGVLLDVFLNGEFWEILSVLEWVLRYSSQESYAHMAVRSLFDLNFVPYVIGDSTDPICIAPTETPESSAAIAEAFEQVHQSGVTNAHQNLRSAASHINAGKFSNSVADSIHAVEAMARDITGKANLGPALKALEKEKLIENPLLKEGITKLYAYASDTVRHGQPQAKAQKAKITRDEALLVFSTCVAISGFLASKKIELQAKQGDDANEE